MIVVDVVAVGKMAYAYPKEENSIVIDAKNCYQFEVINLK